MINNVSANPNVYWPSADSSIKSVNANAASFQSMLQSHQANSSFGIGSTGTKTIIASPLQMKSITPYNVSSSMPVMDVSASSAVFDENTPMEEYLDIYKSIYAKYAAVYGDGFESTPSYCFAGNEASEAGAQKINQMKKDFHDELATYIPSDFLIRDGSVSDTIHKLFYEEKYGLKGLSAQEQINKVMSQFSKGSFHDFNLGISILHKVGAITGDEARIAISEAITLARNEEFEIAMEKYDYSNIEEFLKQYYENIILHMNNTYSAKYDWADMFKNKPAHQYDGRDALVGKLFG